MKTRLFVILCCLISSMSIAQVRVIENGNVGVKKDMPEHELDVEGVTRTSDYFEGVYANKAEASGTFERILFPEDVNFFTSGNSTGIIKINLPLDWSNHMLRFSVEVFNYRINKSFSLDIAGYPYAGNGGYWTNTSTSIEGGVAFAQVPVRFGHDGTRPCVLIGDPTTEWSNLNVTISELYVRAYYDNPLDDWTDGWNISLINSLPSNIDRQHYVSSAYQALNAMDLSTNNQHQTAKFFFYPSNQNPNSTRTIGKLHLPHYYTFAFKVTVSSDRGLISYLFTGYGGVISKYIIEASPRGDSPLDELVDVDIQHNTDPYEAIIQIINNDPVYALYEQNIIVESYARLVAPYFTALDENTSITPHNYNIVQNTVAGKWENTDNTIINTLDKTIARTGDVFVNNSSKGFVVKDQINGSCYRIITQDGTLVAQLLGSCPQ